jgi:hypothetical protein
VSVPALLCAGTPQLTTLLDLEPHELVKLQLVSCRLLNLCRDNNVWKQLCFEHSVAERRRRRQDIGALDPRLQDIVRDAQSLGIDLGLGFSSGGAASLAREEDTGQEEAQKQTSDEGTRKRARLLANWDPTYPQEKTDWYEEYIQRHAEPEISWFQEARQAGNADGNGVDDLHREATGAGILYSTSGIADKLIAPLEDGSICIWDASPTSSTQGRITARSAIGLLANKGADLDYETRLRQSRQIMTETGAVECVSIDSHQNRGFFAVQNILNEVDLNTLQVVSRTPYPFPITALSEAQHPTPLTIGTNWTLHLHDPRQKPVSQSPKPRTITELIGGHAPDFSSRLQPGDFGDHVSLSQPGALSILHLPTARTWDGNGDIWVAGRFTSLLNFDRRLFPRLRGTVHSGARISSLSALPYPFINHSTTYSPSLIAEKKSTEGHTLIAAGEYKGKGSLELYSLSPDPARGINSSDSRTTRNADACYQNRQTASSSKLLSVAPHGTRLVFSDGNGGLKWVERDASTLVRQFNISDYLHLRGVTTSASVSPTTGEHAQDDIVQKLLPTVSRSPNSWANVDIPLGQDNLVIWTGDGRLGTVGFGSKPFDVWEEAAEEWGEEEERRREREREYGSEMRRALEQQAREVRWLRGYGL